MPRFSANLSTLFTERPLLQRPAAAAAAGFEAVEIQFPYEVAAERLARAIAAAGVEIALINVPIGDWKAGERGLACLPGRQEDFRRFVETARAYAAALGCGRINILAGVPGADADLAACLDVLSENLAYAAKVLSKDGIRAVVEAINPGDVPGFLLNTSRDALAALDRAGHGNLFVQCDLYHMARTGEDIPAALAAAGPRIGHIQFADAPGRHEPGTGSLDFGRLFAAIDAIGYEDWVGAEYNPSRRTEETLDWLSSYS